MVQRSKIRLFPPLPLKNRLGLTTGEGVGRTIAAKALSCLKPVKHIQWLIWTDKRAGRLQIPSFQTKVFSTATEALQQPFSENTLLEIPSSAAPGHWVEEAGRLCCARRLSGLVTGPMRKKTWDKSHPGITGHTALLKKISKTKNVFMCFLGSRFHVALLTDHTPFKKIRLKKRELKALIQKALCLRDFLLKDPRPVGVLGLNPHAGENGLLGFEEERILKPLLLEFSRKEAAGPLPPDSAFLKKNLLQYSLFIALYHDQGLIPFKTAHNFKGAALSIGLPFIRAGVDHGTGFDLQPMEAAQPDSLISAFNLAVRLIRKCRI